jgi:hypothetical protein
MPCVSGNYDPKVGILINCAIFPQSHLAAFSAPLAPGSSPPNLTMFMGLVDTGASATCISKNVVSSLRLQPSGKTKMSGSTGQSNVDQFTFVVGFLFGAQQAPTGAVSGQLYPNLVQGCEFTSHGFGFDVLIGRDIICKGALSLSFDGHFVLAF